MPVVDTPVDLAGAFQFDRRQRLTQHRGIEPRQTVLGNAGMADMPRLGRDTAPLGGIRPEEPEARRMARKPSIEPRERAALPIFLRHQPGPLVGRQSRGIVDIEVGAPMMAAGTGQRRPREDRLDALRDRQRRCQEHLPRPVEQWTIAAELLVPDEALTV